MEWHFTILRCEALAEHLDCEQLPLHFTRPVALTQAQIARQIREAEAALDRLSFGEAFAVVEGLIGELRPEALRVHEPTLRSLIDRFYPKRRRDLGAALDARFTTPEPPPTPRRRQDRVAQLKADWRSKLDFLSAYQIFQWTTHYRSTFSDILTLARDALLEDSADQDVLLQTLHDECQRHAGDIYAKGFQHVTRKLGFPTTEALSKSAAGLRSFLSCVEKIYADSVLSIESPTHAPALRSACSAAVTGIVTGYGDTNFGGHPGWTLLPTDPRGWVGVLGLVRADDAKRLHQKLDASDRGFHNGLADTIIPVLGAIDQLVSVAGAKAGVLPVATEYIPRPARIEVSLQSLGPSATERFVDLHCYTDGTPLSLPVLRDALARNVSLVAGPLSEDAYQWWQNEGFDQKAIVDTARIGPHLTEHQDSVTAQAKAALQDVLLSQQRLTTGTSLIRNYPDAFPLDKPLRRPIFLVNRTSVSRLLQQFERETGVHLWCSVRRSGKTTACRDLAAVSGSSIVVNQTMRQEALEPDLNVLYNRVDTALEQGRQIPPDFWVKVVRDSAIALGALPTDGAKLILVLDEYEQLFGRLAAKANQVPYTEYTVVQPLLSQMATFSEDNLLILLGQNPDAHQILLAHNQLSPLVRQDAFPLFEHASGHHESEFSEFLRRVLQKRSPFDPSFADAVFEDTSGHPYLTVNIMVDLFDWLIEGRRQEGEVYLTRTEFSQFRQDRMTLSALERSTRYPFMRKLVADGLSDRTRRRDPWLYAVTTALHRLGSHFPNTLRCPEPAFKDLVKDVSEPFGWTSGELLRTAQMGNFLQAKDGAVGPTIPLLARLAARAHPS